jgi:hypothetical protein
MHLIEAAYHEAAMADVDQLVTRAAELIKADEAYLKSAESDLAKMAHRVPAVTVAALEPTTMTASSRKAEELRQAAVAGSGPIPRGRAAEASMGSDVPAHSTQRVNAEALRAALGTTKLGRLSGQFRR